MLQLNHIKKEYKTGDLVQKALDDVSLNLRDNEFVAILGPSGSGKTTLLNVIGGLDRYDSGDLIINGISTKKYTDRDWDSYRNHTIGFVFQSYNLIPHQTVLSNVELALTISGISGAERRSRATKALEQVGLGDQLHKHPSEMSGGQMQRVAIARALVNNPDILLADEPTGALDSDTSIQVMELLKEVAKDRLVVMVTHNPELAEQYATRIVRLRDGVIQSDTAPFTPDDSAQVPPVHKNLGRSSMSPLTALALSFNNLLTKKTRTLLTAFAGSIGIIGIALILSLSAGVSNYIQEMERSTLSEYPLQISTTGVDLAALLDPGSYTSAVADNTNVGATSASSTPEGMVTVRELLSQLTEDNSSVNDLASLKKYLDSERVHHLGGCCFHRVYLRHRTADLPPEQGRHRAPDLPGQQPFCAEQHHLCRRHRLFHDQPERVYRDGRRAFAVRRSVRCQGRPLAGKLQRGRSCAEFGWQHQRLRSLYSGH